MDNKINTSEKKLKNIINNFIIGLIVGIIYIYIFFGFKIVVGSNINYHINFMNIHWHHWLISVILIIIICLTSIKIIESYKLNIIGFLSSLIFHGLLYEDRLDFSVIK